VPDLLHDIEFRPGRFGRSTASAGVFVRERTALALASVLAGRDQATHVAQRAEQSLAFRLPERPRAVCGGGLCFLWCGPHQWLAAAAGGTQDFETHLADVLGAGASIVDQSDSRVCVEVWGPDVRDMLAKGVSIDLHPDRFHSGDVAPTAVSHLHVLLWQVSDEPRYRLLVVRTYFESFWRWLSASAAEFGGEVLPPQEYAGA
jgi:sarcosine oxidase subunit gamma